MFSMVQVNRIYLIFNPVHFLVDSSEVLLIITLSQLNMALRLRRRAFVNRA